MSAYRELDVLTAFGRAEVINPLIGVTLLCGNLSPGHQPLQTQVLQTYSVFIAIFVSGLCNKSKATL